MTARHHWIVTSNATRILLPILLLPALLVGADPDPAALAREAGGESGLAVVVAPSSPAVLAGLASGGRLLVHALHRDPAAVDALRRALAGTYGPVSLDHCDGYAGLLP